MLTWLNTAQLFTVTLPTCMGWFADNFFYISDDVANSVVNVFSNMGKIIGHHVMTIFEFILLGMKKKD